MNRLLKKEFLLGCQKLGCSSLEALKARLPALRKEMEEKARFRPFWDFLYRYHCEVDPKLGLQNSPPIEYVVAVASMILGKPHRRARFPMLDAFVAFLSGSGLKTIKRDDWMQMLELGEKIKADLSNYSAEAAAWPTLFDDFVEAFQAGKLGGGGGGGGAMH